MAVSGKYGRLNIPKIGDDEPVFVLRAQDRLAVFAVEMYGVLAVSHGSSVVEGLENEINAFQNWSGSRKIPD